MALWSGLSYYQPCTQQLSLCPNRRERPWRKFSPHAQALATLPGIGRSTAGAIAAFCFAERTPILDANVRRVLTRVLGFDADLQ